MYTHCKYFECKSKAVGFFTSVKWREHYAIPLCDFHREEVEKEGGVYLYEVPPNRVKEVGRYTPRIFFILP